MTREDFIAWREHPVTRWAFRALATHADRQKDAWISASWDGGEVDPAMRLELHTRADAYRALAETTYEGFCQALGDEPEE